MRLAAGRERLAKVTPPLPRSLSFHSTLRETPPSLRAATIARCACGGDCPRCKSESGSVGTMQISQPGDPFEREADRVADQVMRMAEPESVSSAPAAIQRKCSECEADEKKVIRTKRGPSAHSDPTLNTEAAVRAAKGGGAPLSREVRSYFEPRFGHDFGGVRVHSDGQAAEGARAVQARAYTLGHNIMFGAGEYSPTTKEGKQLLTHELVHVVQQEKGKTNFIQRTPASKVSCASATPLHVPGPAPVDIADPVGVITAAENRANQMFDDVIGELDFTRQRIIAGEPAAFPTISDAIAQGLRLMGLDPEDRAVWTAPTGTGRRSVTLLLRRLRLIRGTIGSGSFFFVCLGTGMTRLGPCGPPAGSADLCSNAVAATCAGHFLTAFCPDFWIDSAEDQAARIIHESSHNFATFIGHTGRFTNAECFARLVQVFAGVPEALQRVDLCSNP